MPPVFWRATFTNCFGISPVSRRGALGNRVERVDPPSQCREERSLARAVRHRLHDAEPVRGQPEIVLDCFAVHRWFTTTTGHWSSGSSPTTRESKVRRGSKSLSLGRIGGPVGWNRAARAVFQCACLRLDDRVRVGILHS